MPSSATGLEKILADIQRIIDAVSGPGLADVMTEAGANDFETVDLPFTGQTVSLTAYP